MKFLLVPVLFFCLQSAAQLQSLPLVQEVMDHFNKEEYAKVIPVAEKAIETTKKELGEASPFHNGMVMFLAMSHWYLYHYPEAEKWMLKNKELTLKYSGEKSLEYISCLNRIALLYRELGQFPASEAYYLKADTIARSFTGGNDTVYAKNLNNLAALYQYTGKYDKATGLFEKSRDLFLKLTGEKNTSYASTLNNLATIYNELGQFEKAKPLLLKVLELRKMLQGEDHPDYAQALNNLGYIQAMLGQIKEAELNYTRASEIYKKSLGPNHPDYASSINNLAELFLTTGEYAKAKLLYDEALEIRKKTVGERHPDYSQSLNNLGTYYETLGLYDKAEQLFGEAMEKTASALGEEHPAFIISLNNMAGHYQSRGNYEKAEPLYQRARDLRKKIFGDQHPSYAMSLNNLGTLYLEIGQFEKAAQLFQQSGEIWKKALGAGHYNYAMSLNNLAAACEDQHQYEKAETLYTRALEIRRAVFGENHNDFAVSLNNLAGLYMETKQYDKAELFIKQANVIWKKILNEDNPSIALGLNNLAAIYRRGHRHLDIAEQLYLQAISLRKKILGENHPLTAESENDLALLYMNMGQFSKAEPLLLTSSQKNRANLQSSFPVLSEKEKAGFIKEEVFYNDCNNSFLYNDPVASPRIVNNNVNLQLFYKSLSLADTRNMLEAVRSSRDSSIRKLVAEWQSVRTVISAQYALPAARRAKDLAEKEAIAENLEKELNRRSASFREQQTALRISVNDIRRNLEEDEVAIEFVSFNYYDKTKTDSIIYAAYLIRKQDSAALFIPLFEERQLQALIDRAGRSATGVAKTFYGVAMNFSSDIATDLYKLIWKPLEKHLQGVKKISFSPSGKLFGIAFHALPAGSGKLLMDNYELRQYVSTRQIALRSGEKTRDQPGRIVLFGDANYSMDSAAIAKNIPADDTGQDLVLRGGGGWPELPFTGKEVDTIKKIFSGHNIPAVAYLKEIASEGMLKKLDGHSPVVLHIATHGFYVPEKQYQELVDTTGRGGGPNMYKLSEDPLMRNGLILAGGNYAWSGNIPLTGVDDGILTAYEIAQLNLGNTRLVVLSACETALGDIHGTEGVYGLQRAFKLAGVDKMIISLWQVPDLETSLLMTKFYSNWLDGAGVREAFLQAQTAMRKQYPPFSWAAFVLVE